MGNLVDRLYPAPASRFSLSGLYLAHRLREQARPGKPYVYSNFISSLDGRISEALPDTHRRAPPRATRHPHDWRLYLELAAQADALIVSGRRWRELHAKDDGPINCAPDLADTEWTTWRIAHGLTPQPACIVLSASLDLPLVEAKHPVQNETIVLTGKNADAGRVSRLRDRGLSVIAGKGDRVDGDDVRRLLHEREFTTTYCIAGPEVFYTLASANLLDRLYLSFAFRLLAGTEFDTISRGAPLSPPMNFALHELYLDAPKDDLPGLLLGSFDRGE